MKYPALISASTSYSETFCYFHQGISGYGIIQIGDMKLLEKIRQHYEQKKNIYFLNLLLRDSSFNFLKIKF